MSTAASAGADAPRLRQRASADQIRSGSKPPSESAGQQTSSISRAISATPAPAAQRERRRLAEPLEPLAPEPDQHQLALAQLPARGHVGLPEGEGVGDRLELLQLHVEAMLWRAIGYAARSRPALTSRLKTPSSGAGAGERAVQRRAVGAGQHRAGRPASPAAARA